MSQKKNKYCIQLYPIRLSQCNYRKTGVPRLINFFKTSIRHDGENYDTVLYKSTQIQHLSILETFRNT